MKRAFMILMAAVLLTVGCAKAPDASVIAKTNTEQLVSSITEQASSDVPPATDYLAVQLGTPERIEDARIVSGVPVTQTDISCDGAQTWANERAPWDYEHLRLTLREDGTLVYLLYASPYDMGATVTDDAELLPFSEIAAIYEIISPLTYRYKQQSENGMQLTLTEVQLGLMRVTEVNRRDAGTLIPVWDFTAEWENADGSARSGVILTLNAMDGSFVNRGLGY